MGAIRLEDGGFDSRKERTTDGKDGGRDDRGQNKEEERES